MASAEKAIREFSGKEHEEILDWLKELRMITRFSNMSQNDIYALIISKLRGVAQTWAAEIIDNNNGISLKEFLERLKSRFVNSKQ
ncbi:hypothetical protein GVAV_000080 [Gurleya vavrai]